MPLTLTFQGQNESRGQTRHQEVEIQPHWEGAATPGRAGPQRERLHGPLPGESDCLGRGYLYPEAQERPVTRGSPVYDMTRYRLMNETVYYRTAVV